MIQRFLPFVAASAIFFACAVIHADSARVSTASMPIPIPGTSAISPVQLRSHNPNVLEMVGTWDFQLTHGEMNDTGFVPEESIFSDSSEESEHPAADAFTDSPEKRWCASGPDFPQWLQADLGATLSVSTVTITWERTDSHMIADIESSVDGKAWTKHSDAPAITGNGDYIYPVGVSTRFIKVEVTGGDTGNWASIRSCKIAVKSTDGTINWSLPALPKNDSHTNDFSLTSYDSTSWDKIQVPSNWEMLGYSYPTYDSVDNTVGLYRRLVDVPASFEGKRIVWRFDGVMDGAEIFVNGIRAGYHESGYTSWDIDLTDLVKPGQPNLFAVRVCKKVPSYECETGDFQCMGGIFRDNYLIAIPQTHISDLTLKTDLDAAYKNAALSADVPVAGAAGDLVTITGTLETANGVVVPVPGLSASGTIGSDGTADIHLASEVIAPKLWNAEQPNLYYLVLTVKDSSGVQERVEQRFGFRNIVIAGNILLWNGKRIKCYGICRHDEWANLGFALNEAAWNKDITLIKAANINAIRTSHYNHAERFLELCEEKGIYILDEVPACWIGDGVKSPTFLPYLIQRADETLARDKNKPCVLAWSLGNENDFGPNLQALFDHVNAADPTRPAFVSCMPTTTVHGQPLSDTHYPDALSFSKLLNGPGRTAPIICTENPHTYYNLINQNYDPGISDVWTEALMNDWKMISPADNIVGSFIWEWQNQGLDLGLNQTHESSDGSTSLVQENNKGIVDAYRNPKSEWWIVKNVYSPILVAAREVTSVNGTVIVPITNRYSFTNLNTLDSKWQAYRGNVIIDKGTERIACAPLSDCFASFPAPKGVTSLKLEFLQPDGTLTISARLAIHGAPAAHPPAALTSSSPLKVADSASSVKISNALQQLTFGKETGEISSWAVRGQSRIVGGPVMNLGESMPAGSGFYSTKSPLVVKASTISWHRSFNNVLVTVTSDINDGDTNDDLGSLQCVYVVHPDAVIDCSWTFTYGVWGHGVKKFWEAGLKLKLPLAYDQMTWSRKSYFTDYPKGHISEPLGSATSGDVSYRASKRNLNWMALFNSGGNGVSIQENGSPLIGRADPVIYGTDTSIPSGPLGHIRIAGVKAQPGDHYTALFASTQISGPTDLSRSWTAERDIMLDSQTPISGSFILSATDKAK